ncbi:hypothetical protein ASF98_11270 [Arthrobacter sp. Leaf337]|nr:hypothetical protein ASF98_11270 [Arthrobacter sp. Leaf337]
MVLPIMCSVVRPRFCGVAAVRLDRAFQGRQTLPLQAGEYTARVLLQRILLFLTGPVIVPGPVSP